MTAHVLPSTDAEKNLAAEDVYFRSGETCALLWRNAPCVILGKNQIAENETSALCRKSVPVFRRTTGGGAVYHDLDNINFSFCLTEETPQELRVYAEPVMAFLRSLGLAVCFSGRNDILLRDKKISGMAMRHAGGRTLAHGTLLFRRDAAAMDAYLTPDTDKLLRHGVASVNARTGELAPYLPDVADAETCLHLLRRFLCAWK